MSQKVLVRGSLRRWQFLLPLVLGASILGLGLLMRSVGRSLSSRRATLTSADDTLDGLCSHVSGVIAGRLARELAAGRAVTWTPALRLLPEGLEYRAQGFLGRKDPAVIPYDQVASYDIQQGEMTLWVRGTEKPPVREKVSAPNFFPGLRLLDIILHPEEDDQEEPEAEEEEGEE